MEVIIQPSPVKGEIWAPPSKSSMQRALAAALLNKGRTTIKNPGHSADDKAALNIIRQLGATYITEGSDLVIHSNGVAPLDNGLDAGESGLSSRLFTSLASLSGSPITINGKGSLLKRPFDFFEEVLPALGVTCSTNNGHLPMNVCGPIVPRNITIDGSLSSQYLTGLLMAYSAAGACDVAIEVKGLNSKPYIDLTLEVMRQFNMKLPVNEGYQRFYFDNSVPAQGLKNIEYTVEGDWSGAAFLLVAGAIAGDLVIRGLDVFSAQADKAVLQALMQTGVAISIQEDQILIRSTPLQAFHFNAVDCPDLFPPLVALAACCNGTSVIEGVGRLTHKESDRASTLQEEFAKMGADIRIHDDLMIIAGGKKLSMAKVHSHGDHRIAMALAIAALQSAGPVTISSAEAIEKSYPHFFNDLKLIGAELSLNQ
jgi:3-phosphoshikimate 1-carboxyvinyltransferase